MSRIDKSIRKFKRQFKSDKIMRILLRNLLSDTKDKNL